MKVLIAPKTHRQYLRDAIVQGGGIVTDNPSEARAIVWTVPDDPSGLEALLSAHQNIRYVQLPWAGVEHFSSILDDKHVWCGGQGVYSDDVAEHTLALTLALLRQLPTRARATSWGEQAGHSLRGAHVCILGAGGIAQSLSTLLQPFSCDITVVRRRPLPFASGNVVLFENRMDAMRAADVVVVALALTSTTVHIIDAQALQAMKRSAVLVNVARGRHVDTDALVLALNQRIIAGAALDVTDPEPLPDDHPLWRANNILITPHTANTPQMAMPVLSARVTENIRRFQSGRPPLGLIDLDAHY
jgi:phosphoglycerate dehydrogenase-like enzyme